MAFVLIVWEILLKSLWWIPPFHFASTCACCYLHLQLLRCIVDESTMAENRRTMEKKSHSIVGRIIGHTSDGDNRIRQLMHTHYKSLAKATKQLTWLVTHGFFYENKKCRNLHDQDWIHNGKKLINLFDSLVKILHLREDGVFTCTWDWFTISIILMSMAWN